MEPKFTKGKWEVGEFAQKVWADNRKGCVASCSNEYHNQDFYVGFSNEEMHANALLISKAPLLFADLLDIVWLVERGATYEEVQERIKTSKQLLKEATEL